MKKMIKQIMLIRHAKVLTGNSTKCTASQMSAWVEQYNVAPIDTILPLKEVITQIQSAHVVVASTLSRTRDSLGIVGITPKEQNALFDEAEIPQAKGKILKLSPKTWLVMLRLMMFVGMGKKSQSLKVSKSRAKEAANYLASLAIQHESVALMGHGGMNWLMGKELENLGWKLTKTHGGNDNWGYRVYAFES